MEEKKLTIVKNSAYYGAILGFALIIVTVISYITGSMENKTGQSINSFFQYIVIIIGIVIGTKHLRNNTGGYITYGRALGSGTLICMFSSILLAVYTYIFYTFIDPGFNDRMLSMIEQNFAESGMSEEQIELTISMSKKFMNPAFLSFSVIPGTTFGGFIFSLFTSIALRKNKPMSFENTNNSYPPQQNIVEENKPELHSDNSKKEENQN